MPMNKNSTPTSTTFFNHIPTSKESPSKFTLEKIRQFARVYSIANIKTSSLSGVIAN